MNQLERNQSILYKYIPELAVPTIAQWIYKYDFKLKIKKSRSSKYGDYRAPINGKNHIISINHDLNKYSFLITLVHEIAHLTNYNKYKDTVAPHGEEWKLEFKILMNYFLYETIFPEDVTTVLKNYMKNPAASSCSDVSLLRVLKKYDERDKTILLEEILEGSTFMYGSERLFIKGEQVRKRFKCKELKTKRMYLFNPLTEVLLVDTAVEEKKSDFFNIFNIKK